MQFAVNIVRSRYEITITFPAISLRLLMPITVFEDYPQQAAGNLRP